MRTIKRGLVLGDRGRRHAPLVRSATSLRLWQFASQLHHLCGARLRRDLQSWGRTRRGFQAVLARCWVFVSPELYRPSGDRTVSADRASPVGGNPCPCKCILVNRDLNFATVGAAAHGASHGACAKLFARPAGPGRPPDSAVDLDFAYFRRQLGDRDRNGEVVILRKYCWRTKERGEERRKDLSTCRFIAVPFLCLHRVRAVKANAGGPHFHRTRSACRRGQRLACTGEEYFARGHIDRGACGSTRERSSGAGEIQFACFHFDRGICRRYARQIRKA